MARRTYHSQFPHPAEKVYKAMSAPEYWNAKMEEFRKLTPQSDIERLTIDSNGIDVTLTQILPRTELPGIAQAVMKTDLVITRQEFLGPFDADHSEGLHAKGTYTASIPSGPGSLEGWQQLVTAADGCTLERITEVKVSIPLINGKLESMILENLDDLFAGETEFTDQWIATNL